jgi:hypothetical protein
VNLDDDDSYESRQISNMPMQSTEVQKQSIPDTAEPSDTRNAIQDSQHSPASTTSKEGTSVVEGNALKAETVQGKISQQKTSIVY